MSKDQLHAMLLAYFMVVGFFCHPCDYMDCNSPHGLGALIVFWLITLCGFFLPLRITCSETWDLFPLTFSLFLTFLSHQVNGARYEVPESAEGLWQKQQQSFHPAFLFYCFINLVIQLWISFFIRIFNLLYKCYLNFVTYLEFMYT